MNAQAKIPLIPTSFAVMPALATEGKIPLIRMSCAVMPVLTAGSSV